MSFRSLGECSYSELAAETSNRDESEKSLVRGSFGCLDLDCRSCCSYSMGGDWFDLNELPSFEKTNFLLGVLPDVSDK